MNACQAFAISRQSNGNVVRCEELNDTVACFSRGTIASPGSPNLTVLKNVDEAGINSKASNKLLVFQCQRHYVPLSLCQRRFSILDQLHPGIAAYHVPVCLRLTGPLAFDALERSLEGIVVRIGARIS